jgi:nucleotide-binding universal stress UspA family protein
VLVALDGSSTAELALRVAVTAARRDHAALTLLAVAPDVPALAHAWPAAGVADAARLREDVEREADELLRATVARIPDDIPVTTVLRHRRPGPQICAYAAEVGTYGAIFLGARGVGRVRSLLGSVSGYVLHHAQTPVFVAHAPDPDRSSRSAQP